MPGPDAFRHPPRLPLIAPSILAADFARMGDECAAAIGAGADLLHLDVMDGHFVPNLTMGPDMCRCLRRALPGAVLDVHLMVTNPARFVEPFARAGADMITFHVEAVPPEQVAPLIGDIHAAGCAAGLAINPPTPVEAMLPHLAAPDMILVMSVNPGYAGQAFIESVLSKTRIIRSRLRTEQRLEMDGGLSPTNAGTVRGAGCDVLVAGSALFGQPRSAWAGLIKAMRDS